MSSIPLFLIFLVFTLGGICTAQTDDESYLDEIQKEVEAERLAAEEELVEQVKIVEASAKDFIGAQIKTNLFKALKIIASKDELSQLESMRRARQFDEEDEDEDYDGEGEGTADAVTGTEAPTVTTRGLIPQIFHILKAVVGARANATRVVNAATRFLPETLNKQIVGMVDLFYPEEKQAPATTTPMPSVAVNTNHTLLVNKYNRVRDSASPYRTGGKQGREKEHETTSVSLTKLSADVQENIDALNKNVPDIFQGAREAYKLLDTVSEIYDRYSKDVNKSVQ